MLSDSDRIFTNLYGWQPFGLAAARIGFVGLFADARGEVAGVDGGAVVAESRHQRLLLVGSHASPWRPDHQPRGERQVVQAAQLRSQGLDASGKPERSLALLKRYGKRYQAIKPVASSRARKP